MNGGRRLKLTKLRPSVHGNTVQTRLDNSTSTRSFLVRPSTSIQLTCSFCSQLDKGGCAHVRVIRFIHLSRRTQSQVSRSRGGRRGCQVLSDPLPCSPSERKPSQVTLASISHLVRNDDYQDRTVDYAFFRSLFRHQQQALLSWLLYRSNLGSQVFTSAVNFGGNQVPFFGYRINFFRR